MFYVDLIRRNAKSGGLRNVPRRTRKRPISLFRDRGAVVSPAIDGDDSMRINQHYADSIMLLSCHRAVTGLGRRLPAIPRNDDAT